MPVGPLELVLLLAILLLLFGAKRLPSAGRGLGQGLREFKAGIKESKDAPTLPPGDQT